MAVARSRSECASISAAASVFPLLLPGKGFRVFLVRLLSGSARVSPSGFGEYRPRRLTQLTRQCRCAPSNLCPATNRKKSDPRRILCVVRPGFGTAPHAPVQFCTPALFRVGPRALRGVTPTSPRGLPANGRSRLDVYRGIQPTEVPGWHPGANSTSGNTSMNAL